MDRLFLDANILFSAAYRAKAGLLRFWKLQSVVLCSSRYALEEARVNLEHEAQQIRLEKLAKKIQLFDAISGECPHDVRLRDKDVPILLAAIAAKATHLITGDIRDFGPYLGKKIEGILVLTPAAYLKQIGQP